LGRGIKIGSFCILLCRSSTANAKELGISVRAIRQSRAQAGKNLRKALTQNERETVSEEE
jgi:hypothetical protein